MSPEREKELKRIIAEIAIPLEVLRTLDNDWKHPHLRWWWRRLVSKELRGEIIAATDLARKALGVR